MSNSMSISVSQGRFAPYHDARFYTPTNADKNLSANNVYLKKCTDFESEFNAIFADSVDNYNTSQKRSDRQISNYYDQINNGKCKENPVYEYVFQFGNMLNNCVRNSEFQQKNEDSEAMLLEFYDDFKERYPNFHVVSAAVHMDEQTPHLHVAFVPVATGYKKGMEKRCSLTKALDNMGFPRKGNGLSISRWQTDCKQQMERIMNSHGYEREYMNNTDKHMDVDSFKLRKENEVLEQTNIDLAEENVKLMRNRNRMEQEAKQSEAQRDALQDEISLLRAQSEELTAKIAMMQQQQRKMDEREESLNSREMHLNAQIANFESERINSANEVKNVTNGFNEFVRKAKYHFNEQVTSGGKPAKLYDAWIASIAKFPNATLPDDLIAQGKAVERRLSNPTKGSNIKPISGVDIQNAHSDSQMGIER